MFAEACSQIIARPGDKALLRRWMAEIAPGDAEAGLEWACAMQAAHPTPIMSVLGELANRRGEDAPRLYFGDLLDTTLESGALAPIRAAWEAFLDRRPIEGLDAPRLARDADALVPVFFRFARRPAQLLHLTIDHPPNLAALEASGVALQPMREFLSGFLRVDATWARIIETAALPSDVGRGRVMQAEAECGWVDRAIAAGQLTVTDPLDGSPCDASDGMIVFGRAVYRFDGIEPFFLLTGGPWNAPQGFYLPRRDLMLSFGGEWRGVLSGAALGNLLASYLRRRMLPPVATERPRGFTLYLPPTDNFAHQHWNFQTSVERLIRLGLLDRLAKVRFSGTEFFGEMAEIFPELVSVGVERPRRAAIVDPAPRDPTRLVLPAAGFFIPRSLSERVIATLRARPKSKPDVIDPSDVARPPGAPLVWLALRVRGRAWVDQEEGVAFIIRYILDRRPDAFFVIDGFSFPVGDDGTSHQWAGAVNTLRVMAENVRARVSRPDQVINMVGNTMRESVLWAAETDVYFAPYGTTQHKVAWFSSAPGVVYGPPAFKPAQVLRSPGFAAAEISALPTFIIGQNVASTVSESGSDGPPREIKASTMNVALDAQEVALLVWQLLAPRFPALHKAE